jgi:predicted dehydrogenase
MVNYTRRWDPSVIALKQEIASCKRGELRGVMAIYNKGLFNNGSHMVDLLGYLLGSIKVLSAGKKKFDFFENDPSITAQLEAQNEVSILLSCANARDFSIFESQFIFSNSVMTMENGGLFWRERKVDGSFEFFGYRELSEGIRTKGGYGKAMLNAIDNIYSAVTAEHEMRSNGESALHTQKLCCEIFTSSLNS